MIRSSVVIIGFFMLMIVGGAVIFSHHGLLALRKFQVQMDHAKAKVALIEDENRKLKRQVELLRKSNDRLTESQIRSFLGWARSDETVYLEKMPSTASR